MKKTSWGRSAQWYDAHLADDDTYHSKVVAPNLIRVLAVKKGERVIEIACGQGYFAKKISALGAVVTAVDISPELIAIAQGSGEKESLSVSWDIAPADNMPMIRSGVFDTALIILALQNIHNMHGALAEAKRVLKPGGRLVIVLNHPAFRVPKHSNWVYDKNAKIQYRQVEKYLSEFDVAIEMHPGRDSGTKQKETTRSFHRSLQFYVKAFAKEGFLIRRLEEWISHRKSEPGPQAEALDKARKEIPLFMMMEAIRP